ncbi:bifunctional riboflavin kinase/FAD synthetase [Solicola gregarius]|uniref:Riboflavin biosynthesis protein n=1 Tax=Solicola gregarius TaxID=2908642 RepID=A0AA46TGN2_9ACTN|nr:bifunctional riboflavin kinase/FAD synthetase [Solicola gregarius]UYM04489.1 bifunctional riboflavin kinase/FAD synthetase [Solicola gregarius]
MTVWRSIEDVDLGDRPSVVSIGNFDGVHLGHRHVLARAREVADGLADDVVAVTFDPHPMQVIAPPKAPARLTSIDARVRLLEGAGADQVLVLPFDTDMSRWSPEEFVDRVIVKALRTVAVVVGENFRFGARASGDVAFLREQGAAKGFAVEGLALDGESQPWSSTYIRSLVAAGDVAAAAHALDRYHAVDGVVVEGDKRGRELGFPTANIPASSSVAVPADGVYAGWLRVADETDALPAAISVGTNPTFDGADRRVESYVLDRDDLELYGVHVEAIFADRVRGQVTFDGREALIEQMHRDVADVRRLLAEVTAP